MDKFFSLLGKFVLIAVVVGLLAGGGYYFGKKYTLPLPGSVQPTAMVSESSTNAAQQGQNPSPTLNQTQNDPHVAITAGGISPTDKYIMSGFKDWTVSKTHDSLSDKLTFTKGEYQLTIYQAAIDGGECIFPGETPGNFA